MVNSSSRAAMKANSQAFFYNLKTTDFIIRNTTKAFLLDNEGSTFYLETRDIEATRVLLAQVLISLKKEAVLKENLNEIIFADFNNFTTMSLEQNEDFQNNFPDLLVCKLGKEEKLLLDKQSHILKLWMNIIKVKCKKIIFFMENPEHLEKIMMEIGMANIFKLKLDKLWNENEITTNNGAIFEFKNNEANLDDESIVNNESTSARALDEDMNVIVVEEQSGKTSYSETTSADDNADIVKLLQSLDVEELDAVDKDGNTQLHLATRGGKTQIVEFILAHCAQKDKRNNRSSTALHLAVRYGYSTIVNMLLEHGFNVNATDSYQWTPLHNACFYNNDAHLIEMLLKFGAGIERIDKYGGTALHWASLCGHSVVVNSLLKHGAKINAQNYNRYSPLHFATLWNRQEVVQILLEHGADGNIKNKLQQNAFDIARFKNFSNLIRIFENHKK